MSSYLVVGIGTILLIIGLLTGRPHRNMPILIMVMGIVVIIFGVMMFIHNYRLRDTQNSLNAQQARTEISVRFFYL